MFIFNHIFTKVGKDISQGYCKYYQQITKNFDFAIIFLRRQTYDFQSENDREFLLKLMYSISRQPQNSLEDIMSTCIPHFHDKTLKKEKKIYKIVDKKRDLHRAAKQWTKFEKTNYARVLLKTMIHKISVNESFYHYLAQKLSKSPKQIYIFHRRMISQFRSKKDIVCQLLGDKFQEASLKRKKGFKIPGHQIQERKNRKNIKCEGLIDTDSSQCSFQSEDLSYVQNVLFIEKSPDEMFCDDELAIEITDLEDAQQDFGSEQKILNSDQHLMQYIP